MKKFFTLLAVLMSLMLCACSGNGESSSDAEPAAATKIQETEEPTTQEYTSKQPTWSPVTPGSKNFDVKGSDIEVKLSKNFDPYDKSLEITDDEAKEKIYNMIRNICECERIDYTEFGHENIPNGGCYRRVYVKTAGESYTVFVSNTDNIYSNIAVHNNGDARDFLVDEEYAAEFSKLCGIEQPITKID